MAAPQISVVVCTHNPSPDRLQRVVSALRDQQIDEPWELVLIDNASEPKVDPSVISWHPDASLHAEPRLGLVWARLAAVKASSGEVLVFVDDDNVLSPDFLWHVSRIARSEPQLGTWSGQLIPEYEQAPPRGFAKFESVLGVRRLTSDHTAGDATTSWDKLPWGAGMCVRRSVLRDYKNLVERDSRRAVLGAAGGGLFRGEDIDIALTALASGAVVGLRKDLSLTHLLPATRLELRYLAKIMCGNAFSGALLGHIRYGSAPDCSTRERMASRLYLRFRRPLALQFAAAECRGREMAAAVVNSGYDASTLQLARELMSERRVRG